MATPFKVIIWRYFTEFGGVGVDYIKVVEMDL